MLLVLYAKGISRLSEMYSGGLLFLLLRHQKSAF